MRNWLVLFAGCLLLVACEDKPSEGKESYLSSEDVYERTLGSELLVTDVEELDRGRLDRLFGERGEDVYTYLFALVRVHEGMERVASEMRRVEDETWREREIRREIDMLEEYGRVLREEGGEDEVVRVMGEEVRQLLLEVGEGMERVEAEMDEEEIVWEDVRGVYREVERAYLRGRYDVIVLVRGVEKEIGLR